MTDKKIIVSCSFDRTVYPLDSIMHFRVLLNTLVKGEKIYLVILHENGKHIISKTINPSKTKSLDSKSYLYETSIKMKGKEWKVGNSYLLLASYAGQKSSDSTKIAKRKPVLQTDRSVYIIGSDIIVTVIAPDLDRDNQRPEIIGNKPDHSLTISSSRGIIKNYKLRETGDSTGIFQGIIGLLPPYSIKNGKKIRNKARGKGILDGYLPVGIAEEIKFEFKSKSGTAKLNAFSSNFGAAIELNQKIYSPRDRIYLTVVAPDFNFNSNKIDKIGNLPNCKITISTSKGKLSNYQLFETGNDTGIFTGEIILTGSKDICPPTIKNSDWGVTKGKGPRNGLISCSDDDKLSVVLETEYYTVIGYALIKFNVGEIQWDNTKYNLPSIGKITVIDPDMNIDPNRRDKFQIRIWSKTDLIGIKVNVVETNVSSGIFEGKVNFSNKTSTKQAKLKVCRGDTVFAKYEDFTLPMTYQRMKSLDIIASSKIEGDMPKNIKILKNSSHPHGGKYLEPEILEIKVGSEIKWSNEDTAAHTVTSGTPERGADGIFDSSLFMSGTTFSTRLARKGEYPYFCMVHPWKVGKIIVK